MKVHEKRLYFCDVNTSKPHVTSVNRFFIH